MERRSYTIRERHGSPTSNPAPIESATHASLEPHRTRASGGTSALVWLGSLVWLGGFASSAPRRANARR